MRRGIFLGAFGALAVASIVGVIVMRETGLFAPLPPPKRTTVLPLRYAIRYAVSEDIIPEIREHEFLRKRPLIVISSGTDLFQFTGQPPEIDRLTKLIREVLWSQLHSVEGIWLAQRHKVASGVSPFDTHYRAQGGFTYRGPEVFLLLNVALEPRSEIVDGQIVAMDIHVSRNMHVDGFFIEFSIPLTEDFFDYAHKLYEASVIDESLEGTKLLPIPAGHPDQAAEYLGDLLKHRLHRISVGREIYIESPDPCQYFYEETVFAHLRHYLRSAGFV